MLNRFISLPLFALLTFATTTAIAANIRTIYKLDGEIRDILIEGEIRNGDFETFIDLVKINNGEISGVNIYSKGGDFRESMKIGTAIRDLNLSTNSPINLGDNKAVCGVFDDVINEPERNSNCTCASACFFIYIGGVYRTGGYLAVHRPTIVSEQYRNLSAVEAEMEFKELQVDAKEYMKRMGVPEHLQESLLSIPSDEIAVINRDDLEKYYLGAIPYLKEWEKSKCDIWVKEKLEEHKKIKESRKETKDMSNLEKMLLVRKDSRYTESNLRTTCAAEISKQLRMDSYIKYFGEEPDDVRHYRFSKWTDAVEYLDMSIDVLISDEGFIVEDWSGYKSMKKNPTATAPKFTIFLNYPDPNTVESVSIYSHENPSQEFVDILLDTAIKSWGMHTMVDGKWTWETDKYRITIEHTPEGKYKFRSIAMDIEKN